MLATAWSIQCLHYTTCVCCQYDMCDKQLLLAQLYKTLTEQGQIQLLLCKHVFALKYSVF